MLKALMRRRIAAFGRQFDYDVSYMHALLDADTTALWRFSRLQGLSEYSRGVPVDVLFAARVSGSIAEDCGPCTQLVVTMAERAGASPTQLRAVIEGDEAAMTDDVRLAVRFCRGVLCRDPEADVLRTEVERRWGRVGLVSLAFSLVTARLYPTVKYALGYGKACVRVQVGEGSTVVARPGQVATAGLSA